MQEQKHFLRVSYVLYSYKILYIFRYLLYILAIILNIDDMCEIV
jgi:hypothetical protein